MQDRTQNASQQPGMLGMLGKWVGALISLGLVVTLLVWAWSLGTKDVTQVPVIMAQSGPVRVQPENPGGDVAAHQGRAVNTVLEGGQETLAQEDIALAPAPLVPDVPLAVDVPEAAIEVPADGDDLENTNIVDDSPVSDDPVASGQADPQAPVKSFPPRARPSNLRITSTTSPSETPVRTLPEEIEASAIPDGAHMVQLGAFDSEQVALLQWAGLIDAQPDLLGEKQRYIEQTNSGGRVLFRLRAVGYADATETRAACSALVARGLQCIPVRKR